MKIIYINQSPKPDPVKEMVNILDEKWKARDREKAVKKYAHIKKNLK